MLGSVTHNLCTSSFFISLQFLVGICHSGSGLHFGVGRSDGIQQPLPDCTADKFGVHGLQLSQAGPPKLSAKSGKEGDKETKRLSWDRNKMSLQ